MTDPSIDQWFEKAISFSKQLGDLPSAAIWALITFAIGARQYYMDKEQQKKDKVWQEIRLKEVEADTLTGQAIVKIADRLTDQVNEIRMTRVILDERLHKGE